MREVELRPHQRKAVSQLHNGSILCGGVGSGKTRVAMQYYVEKEAPRDVFVITTAKKRDSLDWESEGVAHGVGVATDATFHGTLKVDSWNNLWKYVDVKDAFFIFDEQRLVGSGAWVQVFLKIAKANHWILLSATPGDTWLDYIPVFVANGLYPNRTSFLREHVVYNRYSKFPKVDRYIGVSRLVRHRNALLVQMPYERHTTRILKQVLVDYDEETFKKVVKDRWHPFQNRPLKDVVELFSVMRKVVNTDVSRLEAVRSLTTLHPKLIVFYNFDYELEILRGITETSKNSEKSETNFEGSEEWTGKRRTSKMETESLSTGNLSANSPTKNSTPTDSSQIVLAEWNGHKHQEIPKTDRWVYLVQYTAGAEGWNCIETDACVFYSLNYSYRIFEQCQGRIDRLNTPFVELKYYVLKSKSSIDAMILRAILAKKKFNEPKTEESLRGVKWDLERGL